jgi:5'(3')-deoxyribonucleotidase
MKVLLDVDGVLADLTGALSKASAGLFAPEDVTSYNFADCLSKKALAVVNRCMVEPGFVERLPECKGAISLFADLTCAGHKPVFVTKPYHKSPTWTYERTRWLEKTFGAALEIVHTGHKHLIHGDVLVEDSIENAHGWLVHHPKAWVIIVDRPWNQAALPWRCTRVSELEEIPKLLGEEEAARGRKNH